MKQLEEDKTRDQMFEELSSYIDNCYSVNILKEMLIDTLYDGFNKKDYFINLYENYVERQLNN